MKGEHLRPATGRRGGPYEAILPLLAEGRVSAFVARTVPLDEEAAGQHSLSRERQFGTVVLTF
ncbi:MAG TPA: hypothetical protein VF221_01030 [Chloroflexota bacterium]